MNQKQIGVILIIFGIVLVIFVSLTKAREDKYITDYMKENEGSCYLQDGTCLHAERGIGLYIGGWVISASLILLGIYLGFIDKTQEVLAEHQVKVSTALKEAKKKESKNSKFKAFLSGFDENHQKIIEIINENDGIQQSTIRYKAGMSKSLVSVLIKELEEKEIISRKPHAKTYKVYLRKKF